MPCAPAILNAIGTMLVPARAGLDMFHAPAMPGSIDAQGYGKIVIPTRNSKTVMLTLFRYVRAEYDVDMDSREEL